MKLKYIGLGLGLSLLLLVAAGLHFILPRQDVVQLTGVEVKRMDAQGVINAKNPAEGPTRDVYFINAQDLDSKEPRVFRNEDTGWGFPPYFKFDSADIQAKAQNLAKADSNLVLIRYYGWRSHMFSMFPNITDLATTTSRDEPLPWFNLVFFALLFGIFGWTGWKIGSWFKRKSEA